MWRAWGITLFILSQDLGPPFKSEDHEMTIRPPAGWTRRLGSGPFIARFTPADVEQQSAEGDKKVPPWGITLSHLNYRSNPTPLEGFVKQAKAHIEREFKGSKMLEEKALKIDGRPAYRIVFEFDNTIQIKTVVPRTHLESYLLDASFLKSDEARFRKVTEASIESFQIVPTVLSGDEAASDARTSDLLKSAKIQPGLIGEQWHSVHLVGRKTGHMRTRLTDAGGIYAFEMDVKNDYGEGNVDSTQVRGTFSPDGRTQKVETEQTKANDKKERWQFRASASIEAGQYKAVRDMNGVKEEKSFRVDEGVLFEDVADIVRRSLVGAGKGNWLLKTISPYADEWNIETVEVNGRETADLDGVRREAHVLFCKVDRRRNMTYYYSPEGMLLRQGGVKDAFSIRLSSKEEALGGGKK